MLEEISRRFCLDSAPWVSLQARVWGAWSPKELDRTEGKGSLLEYFPQVEDEELCSAGGPCLPICQISQLLKMGTSYHPAFQRHITSLDSLVEQPMVTQKNNENSQASRNEEGLTNARILEVLTTDSNEVTRAGLGSLPRGDPTPPCLKKGRK